MIRHSEVFKALTPDQRAEAFKTVDLEIRNPLLETFMVYEGVLLHRDGDTLKADGIIVATPRRRGTAATFKIRSTEDDTMWMCGSIGTTGTDLRLMSIFLTPEFPIAILSFEVGIYDQESHK